MALPELKGRGLLSGGASPVGASALPGPAAPPAEEDEASDSESSHADAIIEAVKADDTEGLRSALKAFVQGCVREGDRGDY